MKLEHRTGYCKNCKDNQKLERKPFNNLIHFIITIVLGIFTYGIGSAVWIVVWFILSVKNNSWTCSVCGHKNEEDDSLHTIHNKAVKEESDILSKIKSSYKVILGILIAIAVIFVFFALDFNEEKNTKEEKIQKKRESKNNVSNATINTQEKEGLEKKIIFKASYVETGYCYLYDVIRSGNSVSGSINCKEGKLTINFYDTDSREVVDTQTIPFKDYRFSIKNDNLKTKEFKFKVTEKDAKAQKEKQKILSTVQYHNGEEENASGKCIVENWKHFKYSDDYLVVEGKTSCQKGKISIQIFDENQQSLGMESDFIEFGIFSIFFETKLNPSNVNIKYTIQE